MDSVSTTSNYVEEEYARLFFQSTNLLGGIGAQDSSCVNVPKSTTIPQTTSAIETASTSNILPQISPLEILVSVSTNSCTSSSTVFSTTGDTSTSSNAISIMKPINSKWLNKELKSVSELWEDWKGFAAGTYQVPAVFNTKVLGRELSLFERQSNTRKRFYNSRLPIIKAIEERIGKGEAESTVIESLQKDLEEKYDIANLTELGKHLQTKKRRKTSSE